MEVSIGQWSINYLFQQKDKILSQPKYQRGKVWKKGKDQLLIDSILRGIDLPKIYLRELNNGIYDYEVADGQQRINALYNFMEGTLMLSSQIVNGLDLSKIGHYQIGGKNILELNTKLQEKFKEYKLTVAIVKHATHSEIRTLFGRLQMGDPLTPPEIRNAIISQLGDQIDMFVQNHDFFSHCKIRPERYKRQDYLTHCFALIHFKNKYDLKAPILQRLYFELSDSVPRTFIDKTFKILTWMHEIDRMSKVKIVNKWSFFDIFNFLLNQFSNIKSIDFKIFGTLFSDFEKLRKKTKNPEVLIEGKTPTAQERNLYNYIVSFNTNGGNPKNVATRLNTFESIFTKCLVLKK